MIMLMMVVLSNYKDDGLENQPDDNDDAGDADGDCAGVDFNF